MSNANTIADIGLEMATVVLWTTSSPDPLAEDLRKAGFSVGEALAFSEVTYLCEREKVDVVVLRAEIDEERLRDLKQRVMTIKLRPNATSGEVIRELWQLFPRGGSTIQ